MKAITFMNRKYYFNVLGCLLIVLWTAAFSIIACVDTMWFQIFRDTLAFYGCSCLFAIAIIINCHKYTKRLVCKRIYVPVVYVIFEIIFLYINRGGWGPDYQKYLIARTWYITLLITFVVLNLEAIISKLLKLVTSSIFAVLYIAVIFYLFAMGYVQTALEIMPLSLFPLLDIDEKDYEVQMNYVSIGLINAFLILMTRSLVIAPKTILDGRYLGVFTTPLPAGDLTAMCIVAVIYLFISNKGYLRKKLWLLVLMFVVMAYAIIMTFRVMSKTSILGLILTFFVAFCFALPAGNNKLILKRSILSFILCLSTIILFIIVAELMGQGLYLKMEEQLKSMSGSEASYYLMSFLCRAFNPEQYTNFPSYSISNIIDRISSGRLDIWVKELPGATLAGLGNYMIAANHMHNTFFHWIMKYGWIGGGMMTMMFFIYLIKSIVGVIRQKKSFLLQLLVSAFCLGAFIGETERLYFLPTFCLVMLSAPIAKQLCECSD